MWKEIEELLKNKYDSYNTYLDNMEDIKDIYNFCIEKYHYLGFSDEIWYKLIYEAIKKNIAKDELIGEIFKTIDFKIERYIKKKLRTRNYAFLNVLLKKIYFENGEKNNIKRFL